jgi:hypothetical protein
MAALGGVVVETGSVPASLRAGVSGPTERLHRVFGAELLQEAGILLELRQVVVVTAQNILHRFYWRQCLTKFDVLSVSMGAMLLSSKVEEQPKLVREVIFVFNYIYHTRRQTADVKALDLGGRVYTQWRNEVVNMERLILKELGFCLYRIMDHPHKFILYFVKILDGTTELAQLAWNYLNDASRLDLGLRYPAKVLAATAIFMAARKAGHPLPDDCTHPWYTIMGADLETMLVVSGRILELYSAPAPLTWIEPLCACEYLNIEPS